MCNLQFNLCIVLRDFISWRDLAKCRTKARTMHRRSGNFEPLLLLSIQYCYPVSSTLQVHIFTDGFGIAIPWNGSAADATKDALIQATVGQNFQVPGGTRKLANLNNRYCYTLFALDICISSYWPGFSPAIDFDFDLGDTTPSIWRIPPPIIIDLWKGNYASRCTVGILIPHRFCYYIARLLLFQTLN